MALADRFPRARRLSPILLILAAVTIYFGIIQQHVISKHAVTYQLDGPIEEVTRIDTTWTAIDTKKGSQESNDFASGGSLYFQQGHAPRVVTTTVHVPSGNYWLDIVVERSGKRSATRKRVTLDGDARVFVSVGDQ